MTPEQKLELAANILARGKALVPDRFPKPDQLTTQVWADALSSMFDRFPVGIWPEAVNLWSMDLAGDRMITPKELKTAAYSVRNRWESDPQKAEILNQIRERNRDTRDKQLTNGSFWALRGFKRPKQKHPALNRQAS